MRDFTNDTFNEWIRIIVSAVVVGTVGYFMIVGIMSLEELFK